MQIQDYGEGEQYMQAFPQPAFNESDPQVSYREPEDSQKHAEVLEVPSPESPHGVEPEISHTFENEPVAPTQALYEVNVVQLRDGPDAVIAPMVRDPVGYSSCGQV